MEVVRVLILKDISDKYENVSRERFSYIVEKRSATSFEKLWKVTIIYLNLNFEGVGEDICLIKKFLEQLEDYNFICVYVTDSFCVNYEKSFEAIREIIEGAEKNCIAIHSHDNYLLFLENFGGITAFIDDKRSSLISYLNSLDIPPSRMLKVGKTHSRSKAVEIFLTISS